MIRFVEEAFMYDFNMLIEDKFFFYQNLTPVMQNKIIDMLFGDFKRNFKHVFDPCERGFVNELIINMFSKIIPDKETIIEAGQKFSSIYFIVDGIVSIHMENEDKDTDDRYAFHLLPSKSIFGDFSLLFKTESPFMFKSNFHKYEHFIDKKMPKKKRKNPRLENETGMDERTLRFKNGKATRSTVIMGVHKENFMKLRSCYPRSFMDFRIRAYQRFANYAQHVDVWDMDVKCTKRLKKAWEKMNQARHFDKEMLKKMGTNTPGIFLEQEFIRQKTLIEET